MKNPIGKNPRTNRGIWRVKRRPGRVSLMFINKFYAGETFDIRDLDYTRGNIKTRLIEMKRFIVTEAEKTTRRERVLLILIGLIIAGEFYARVLYPVCG